MPLDSSFLDWSALARGATLPTHGIVGGSPREGRSSEFLECINPATLEPIARVAAFDEHDVDAAVMSARWAFRESGWAEAPPSVRKACLLDLAKKIVREGLNLALMESLSMGKPAQVALEADVPSAAAFFRWYGECVDKLFGEVIPGGPGSFVTATREPLGVVALVTPWNYPLEEAAIRLAPALAAGNSVVLKPSELSPFSAIRLAELAIAAGIPPGVLNVAPGEGRVAGRTLARHGDVDAIGFTGSTATGKQVMRDAALSNMKRVSLECGGKSPAIVFADCPDLAHAAAESARSVFRNSGQVCSASTRLYVERAIAGPFIEKLLEFSKDYRPADPLDPSARVGAVASKQQYQKVLHYIELGLSEGAELILDGRAIEPPGPGYFIGPTIFGGAPASARVMRDEIFGPVLCLALFDDEDEAIALANDSDYGLVASLWTGSLARAHRVARRLEAGSVTVNGADSQSEAAPFGGVKQSGIGREHSLHAFDQYTNLKTTWVHL